MRGKICTKETFSKPMGRTKVNWITVQHEYFLSKEISLSDIANKYGVSLSRVKKVSMKQKWFETKEKIWESARNFAIEQTIDSAKEMLIRHSETARYFQEAGLKLLKKCFKSSYGKSLSLPLALKILALGLKVERDLYSDTLKNYFKTKPPEVLIDEGNSVALTEAIKEIFPMYNQRK